MYRNNTFANLCLFTFSTFCFLMLLQHIQLNDAVNSNIFKTFVHLISANIVAIHMSNVFKRIVLGAFYSANAAITLYPFWTANKYTVTFDANGGTGGNTVTLDYGTALSAPTVTRDGHTFTGWSPSVPATVPASDVTYTAQWTANTYTVTYKPGANGSGSQQADRRARLT